MKAFNLAAMLAAILVSATFVGAAVGPARTAQAAAKPAGGLQIQRGLEGAEITAMLR